MGVLMKSFYLDDLFVEVEQKPIKTIRLIVHPPDGRVTVRAPLRMRDSVIRDYVQSKQGWIQKHRQTMIDRSQQWLQKYPTGGAWFRGQHYPLQIIEEPGKAEAELYEGQLRIFVRAGVDETRHRAILDAWYRQQLKLLLPDLIAHYEPMMGVKVTEFGIKKMKTRWGTCNYRVGRIWINLELIKYAPECLEYIVVHEMAHLIEPSHNRKFVAAMDRFYPSWRIQRKILQTTPFGMELV